MRYVTLCLSVVFLFSCKANDNPLRSKETEIHNPSGKIQRPDDIVHIDFIEPIYTRETHPRNGVSYDALKVVSNRERGTSDEETRDIESIKGDLVITDLYGEVLLDQSMEYLPNEPIKPRQNKILDYGKAWTIYFTNAPELKRLKKAVAMKNKVVVQFKPTDILFTDGSLLH